MVPKTMTHLLQPGPFDEWLGEEGGFSDYFTPCITTKMMRDQEKDATTTEIDLKLSTLRLKYAKVMKKA